MDHIVFRFQGVEKKFAFKDLKKTFLNGKKLLLKFQSEDYYFEYPETFTPRQLFRILESDAIGGKKNVPDIILRPATEVKYPDSKQLAGYQAPSLQRGKVSRRTDFDAGFQ